MLRSVTLVFPRRKFAMEVAPWSSTSLRLIPSAVNDLCGANFLRKSLFRVLHITNYVLGSQQRRLICILWRACFRLPSAGEAFHYCSHFGRSNPRLVHVQQRQRFAHSCALGQGGNSPAGGILLVVHTYIHTYIHTYKNGLGDPT
jgi:hypothetical protein